MRATEFTETINRDILNPAFKHQQEIGDFLLKAEKKSGKLAITCFHEGSVVGSADFNINEKNLTSDLTWVSKQHRSMGVASTMYAYAKMLGNDVVPSSQQLPPGKAMWDAWRKSGEAQHLVAETINPDILNPEFFHAQEIGDFLYTARYYQPMNFDPPSRKKNQIKPNWMTVSCKKGDKLIGLITFKVITTDDGTHLESFDTEVDPAYRNQGVASTMYSYAKMLGNDIKPSPVQLPAGEAMWKAWEKSGEDKHLVAEAINPDTTRKQFTHTQEIGDFTYKAAGQEIGDLDITAFHNGKKIGHAIFNIYGRGIEKRLESGATFVKPAYEKKGVAATMYAYAKMLGNDIKPSPTQTPGGKAMWNSWFDKGDARHLLRDDSYQPPELHTGDKMLYGSTRTK